MLPASAVYLFDLISLTKALSRRESTILSCSREREELDSGIDTTIRIIIRKVIAQKYLFALLLHFYEIANPKISLKRITVTIN